MSTPELVCGHCMGSGESGPDQICWTCGGSGADITYTYADLERAVRAALEAAAGAAAGWYHHSGHGSPQDEIRAIDPSAIVKTLKGK